MSFDGIVLRDVVLPRTSFCIFFFLLPFRFPSSFHVPFRPSFCSVSSVHVPFRLVHQVVLGADNPNNKRKDFVIVKFIKPESAAACIESTNGVDIKGRWAWVGARAGVGRGGSLAFLCSWLWSVP